MCQDWIGVLGLLPRCGRTGPHQGVSGVDSGKRFRASIRTQYDPNTQVLLSTYDYESEDRTITGSFDLTMRQFFPQEIDALLRHNGFDLLAKYGDAEFKPFDKRPSYQTILCRPRA